MCYNDGMDTDQFSNKTKTVLTGVRLPIEDKEIVRQHMRETGSLSFSASLRVIIREWAAMKARDNGNKENRANS